MLNHIIFLWIPFLLHFFGSLFLFKNKNFSDIYIYIFNHSLYFSNLLQSLSCVYVLRNKCLANQGNLIFKGPIRLLYFWYNTIPRKLKLLSYFRLEMRAVLPLQCLKKQIGHLWKRWSYIFLDNWVQENCQVEMWKLTIQFHFTISFCDK